MHAFRSEELHRMKNDLGRVLARGLRSCEPDDLACDTVQAVTVRVDNLAACLFPSGRAAELRAVSRKEMLRDWWRERALASELGQAVAVLTRFARTGEAPTTPIAEQGELVVDAAFGAALAKTVHHHEDDRLDAALGTEGLLAATLVDVVLAARTRSHLALEQDVSLPGLAALTGRAVETIRFQMGVTHRVTWVTAARARAWLANLPPT
jgi:hypothetical protein